jgi:hypothetical protein
MRLIKFTVALLTLLPLSSFAEYSYYFKLPEPISFIDKDSGSTEPTPPAEPEECPENFSTPELMNGYPTISKYPDIIYYNIGYKTDGGFSTSAELADKSSRYSQVILIDVHLNNGTYYTQFLTAENIGTFSADATRDMHLVVRPAFYDKVYEISCSYGPSTLLINKTYDELK